MLNIQNLLTTNLGPSFKIYDEKTTTFRLKRMFFNLLENIHLSFMEYFFRHVFDLFDHICKLGHCYGNFASLSQNLGNLPNIK